MQFIVTRSVGCANCVRFLTPALEPELLVGTDSSYIAGIGRDSYRCELRERLQVINAHLNELQGKAMPPVIRMCVDADDVGDVAPLSGFAIHTCLRNQHTVCGKSGEQSIDPALEIAMFNVGWPECARGFVVAAECIRMIVQRFQAKLLEGVDIRGNYFSYLIVSGHESTINLNKMVPASPTVIQNVSLSAD